MYCNFYDCPMRYGFRQQFPSQPPPFGGPGGGPNFGPGGPGGQGPSFGPGGQGGPGASSGPPSSPPPSFAPQQSQAQSFGHGTATFAIDPGAIRRCMFRYVYIWPRRGRGFWAWLTFVGRRSVAGWRWNGRRWVYFGLDLRSIESFQCF